MGLTAEEAARIRAKHEAFLKRWEDAARDGGHGTRILGVTGVVAMGLGFIALGPGGMPWSLTLAIGGVYLGIAFTHYKLQALWEHERDWLSTVGRALVEERIRLGERAE